MQKVSTTLDATGAVLVGHDGSDPSGTAVRWAARLAARLGTRLLVVRTWALSSAPRPATWSAGYVPPLSDFEDAVLQMGGRIDDGRSDQDNARRAVNDSSNLLIHRQQRCEPGVGEFQRKSGKHEHNKAGEQDHVLPPLIAIHAGNHANSRAAPFKCLAAPDDEIVQEHAADHNDDHADVKPTNPTNCNTTHIG